MTRASLPLLVVLAACGTTDLDDDATHTTDPEPAPLEGPAVDGPALPALFQMISPRIRKPRSSMSCMM